MAGGPSRLAKGVTFWGMVGATMTALKLKESWDEYRSVPGEEDGHGPLALHSPSDPPPSYRDEDLESAPLNGGLSVDTEIPGARPKRKARKDCCVCCGMNCGIFWRAFGFVSMVVIVWQVVRLIIWTVSPAPTGLEHMPEYSKSLGCLDTNHFYQDQQNITYSVAVDPSRHEHRFNIQGFAVGTVTLAAGAPGDEDVKVDMSLRTGDSALLDQVSVYFPTAQEVHDGVSNSRLQLSTPRDLAGSCMRFDMILYVPTTLKTLRLESMSVTQIKFDPNAKLDLDVLSVVMFSADTSNMLLPTAEVQANHLSLEITRGWLIGDVGIANKTTLVTQRGDAISKVKIHPLPSLGETPETAYLQTTSGVGRSDFTWVGNPGVPHRPINAVHRSSRWGDLYLTYTDAEFSGHVDLVSKSYTASGVHGMGLEANGTELPWAGSKDGADLVKVRSQEGWVGLYF
ncbi:hypothetical protein EIP91_007404 [Steccherinum ochraceum]|uniref:Uncharacterized protein n=1 Tax=Steccherinum ochraceum TaxID=92696 RepID=A0A4V2MXV6_9APHY|nr:hypothetical protein EIP91_007404 [Steccherinum ochraceum]